jgi:hypothetical protein
MRYATPVLKDPSLIIKIAENGLKAIGIIASFWFLCISAGVLPKLLLLLSAKLPSP